MHGGYFIVQKESADGNLDSSFGSQLRMNLHWHDAMGLKSRKSHDKKNNPNPQNCSPNDQEDVRRTGIRHKISLYMSNHVPSSRSTHYRAPSWGWTPSTSPGVPTHAGSTVLAPRQR